MERSIKILVSVAVASLVVACVAYSLSAYRAYSLERDAKIICRGYLEASGYFKSDDTAIKDWLRLRRCMTDAIYGSHIASIL
jgi:hypothetical protein